MSKMRTMSKKNQEAVKRKKRKKRPIRQRLLVISYKDSMSNSQKKSKTEVQDPTTIIREVGRKEITRIRTIGSLKERIKEFAE